MTEDFSREISHLITRLERTKKTALREVLAKYDLRLSHSLCLAYIERHPGTRQDDIAAWLVVDKGSVARNAAKLEEMGINLTIDDDSIRVSCSGKIKRCNIKTMPHPGFPTDMQPQITALLSTADGTSMVNEAVWDNRFRYIDELRRMSANISVDGRVAVIEGVDKLIGASVKAVDLRAGAALVLAGLCAEGTTVIESIHHIERGYENIIEKLQNIGADIKKVSCEDKKSSVSAG